MNMGLSRRTTDESLLISKDMGPMSAAQELEELKAKMEEEVDTQAPKVEESFNIFIKIVR